MKLKLFRYPVVNHILHIAVRSDLTEVSAPWLFKTVTQLDNELWLERGRRYPGIDVDGVLNAVNDRGWAVLGSGFALPASASNPRRLKHEASSTGR